jgi:hypothetical protein
MDVELQKSSHAHAPLVGYAGNVTTVFDRFESVVQNYVRTAPIVFDKASGSELFDERGKRYIDFHSAGGSQGFGHNNLKVCSALIDYLCNDRVIQTCDRKSVAKRNFVEITRRGCVDGCANSARAICDIISAQTKVSYNEIITSRHQSVTRRRVAAHLCDTSATPWRNGKSAPRSVT